MQIMTVFSFDSRSSREKGIEFVILSKRVETEEHKINTGYYSHSHEKPRDLGKLS